MGRNPKIKLKVKTDKQLDRIVECWICGQKDKYRNMYFYIDDSNIAITSNSHPLCKHCKSMTPYERNKREFKKKLIEVPTELFNKIQELAKQNERSDNKQIVYLLKKALALN